MLTTSMHWPCCLCCHFLWLYVIIWSWRESVQVFFYRLFIYALPLEIQLSRVEGWGPINQFNPVSLSQAMTWISKVICFGLFCVQWVQLRGDVIAFLLILVEFIIKVKNITFNSKNVFSNKKKVDTRYPSCFAMKTPLECHRNNILQLKNLCCYLY